MWWSETLANFLAVGHQLVDGRRTAVAFGAIDIGLNVLVIKLILLFRTTQSGQELTTNISVTLPQWHL